MPKGPHFSILRSRPKTESSLYVMPISSSSDLNYLARCLLVGSVHLLSVGLVERDELHQSVSEDGHRDLLGPPLQLELPR